MLTINTDTLNHMLATVGAALGFTYTPEECAIIALRWIADHHYSEKGHWYQPSLQQTASHIQQGHAITQLYGVSITDWQGTKGEQQGYAALCAAEGCEGE